jgi:hypothetical protein
MAAYFYCLADGKNKIIETRYRFFLQLSKYSCAKEKLAQEYYTKNPWRMIPLAQRISMQIFCQTFGTKGELFQAVFRQRLEICIRSLFLFGKKATPIISAHQGARIFLLRTTWSGEKCDTKEQYLTDHNNFQQGDLFARARVANRTERSWWLCAHRQHRCLKEGEKATFRVPKFSQNTPPPRKPQRDPEQPTDGSDAERRQTGCQDFFSFAGTRRSRSFSLAVVPPGHDRREGSLQGETRPIEKKKKDNKEKGYHKTMPKVTPSFPGLRAAQRHRAPWAVENRHLLMPTASPRRPAPVGPHYPLAARETSRMAVQPALFGAVGAPAGGPIGSREGGGGLASEAPATFRRAAREVPIGARYTLTAAETRECARIGRERNRKNQQERRTNRRYAANRSDEDISIQGVFGEYAFCRMFDLSIDIHDTTCRNAWTESRFDGVMSPEGWTVDVKTTIYVHVPLRVTSWKADNPPDAYALLIYVNCDASRPLDERAIEPPVIEFRGFASSATVFDPSSRVVASTTTADGRPDAFYQVAQSRLVSREGLAAEAAARGGTLRHVNPDQATP